MAIGKTAARLVACAMALAIAASWFSGPSAAHAAPSLVAGCLPAQAASRTALTTQAQSDMTVLGADISQWQGSVNWKKAAQELKFAIVRCGYGDNLRHQDDARWLENARKCCANGIPMGVYLYSYATNTTMAKSEARHVIRCLREAGLNASTLQLPIYLDMEDASTGALSPDENASIFNAFKKRLNAAGYSKVGVYANCDWWSWRLSAIQLPSELRWVAQWNSALFAGYPSLAEKGCGIWQYTDAASVSGVRGPCDGNYARYDLPFFDGAPSASKPAKANNNASETPKVYVMENEATGDRLYTIDSNERANLKKNGWKPRGALGRVPKVTSMPVYRFYSSSAKAHYFTTSKAKHNQLARRSDWAYEGIAFYSQLASGGKPVYRFAQSGLYRYSRAQSLAGWKANGIGWYSAS